MFTFLESASVILFASLGYWPADWGHKKYAGKVGDGDWVVVSNGGF